MALRSLIGEVLDGKYRIERQLGEGGMGAVYFATHLGTERPVAVKVIAPQFMQHDEFVERFRREARAAGRLRHPNVVDVTDFGFAQVGTEQVAYLVMEYLDGFPLDEILKDEASLPLNWVIDILEQTCSAVDEAHQQGIVHRDLKPENIWLEPNRRGGYTVKVLDFGIAKLDEPELPPLLEAHSLSRPQSAKSRARLSSPDLATLIGTPDDGSAETSAASGEAEAATQLLAAGSAGDNSSEAATMIGRPQAAESEAGTRLLSPDSDAEVGTRILDEHSTNKQLAISTGTGGSLTRVGAILGTPLYMSPEQCRGEALDARSDIYSLGVIAYRLLSGKTPFNGTQNSVMMMHREQSPPALDVKRVPRKVTALVLQALAKKPEDRPASAAAFASALRAHATGTGTLLRQALTLYSEHLPTFLRLALLAYLPVVVVTLLNFAIQIMARRQVISHPWDSVAGGGTTLLRLVVTFFSASVVVGVTTWLVTQVLAVPLRPLLLRPACDALKKRLRPFLLTTLATNLLGLIGIFMCVLPGIYAIANFALVAPVVMMEDLRGRGALKRSRALYKRSRRTVFAIVLIHIGIPILVSVISALLIVAVVKAVRPHANEAGAMVGMIQQLVILPTSIFFSSLASVVTALLYWKTRLAGGETMAQGLAQFAAEEGVTGGGPQGRRPRFGTPMKTSR